MIIWPKLAFEFGTPAVVEDIAREEKLPFQDETFLDDQAAALTTKLSKCRGVGMERDKIRFRPEAPHN